MNRALIFIAVILVALVAGRFAFRYFQEEILAPYTNIRLVETPPDYQTEVEEQYEAILHALDERRTHFPELVQLMGDSLERLYGQHDLLMEQLDLHQVYVRDSIIQVDPESQTLINKSELEANFRYWLGEDARWNNGRGNGAASILRDQWNAFSYQINLTNEQLAKAVKWDEWYQADTLQNQAMRSDTLSWERYTFEGPAVANLASLEALKLDQQERLMEELEFMLEVLVFEM